MIGMIRSYAAVTAVVAVGLLMCSQATAQLVSYSQDFEGMDQTSASALDIDGWKVGANVYAPDGTTYLYNYFTFPAPNGSGGFSNVTALTTDPPGAPPVGAQGLVVFNDYNNADHGNSTGNRIDAHVFQEQTVTATDVGKTFDFQFVAADGDLTGASTALAFLKTIDPGAGFADSSFTSVDTTTLAPGLNTFKLSTTIASSQVGHILQFGFRSIASNFESSGINYDEINFLESCPPGDTDRDGDIDTADLTKGITNFTGAGGVGKTCADGDTDDDQDVDTADLTFSITNFTGASAANPNVPDLVYDPATGNVSIDADGADVISFSLQSGPFNAADFSELPAGLTDNIASQIGWTSFNLFSGLTGTANLGAILPAGLDLAGLEAALTTASYGLALSGGGGGGRLDLIIPEPASMVLIGMGAVALVRRRRAA